MSLLKKTRRLNRILQRSGYEPVKFSDISTILSEELDSNVYILSRKGKVLGYEHALAFTPMDNYRNVLQDLEYPDEYNEKLLSVSDSTINLDSTDERVLNIEKGLDRRKKNTAIIPVTGNRERLGTIIVNSYERQLTEDDLILCEYSAAIVGIEILRTRKAEMEEETRKKEIVELAINTLSYSELEAVEHIFRELNGSEGLLVASKIADKVGITRSVIVNALRKFESAGVIRSRSLGMKGTHITILNDKLTEELKKRI